MSKVNKAALLAGLARVLAEHNEPPRATPASDEKGFTLAFAEIERFRTELRLEQALGLERAAGDLLRLAEIHAEQSEHHASLTSAPHDAVLLIGRNLAGLQSRAR